MLNIYILHTYIGTLKILTGTNNWDVETCRNILENRGLKLKLYSWLSPKICTSVRKKNEGSSIFQAEEVTNSARRLLDGDTLISVMQGYM